MGFEEGPDGWCNPIIICGSYSILSGNGERFAGVMDTEHPRFRKIVKSERFGMEIHEIHRFFAHEGCVNKCSSSSKTKHFECVLFTICRALNQTKSDKKYSQFPSLFPAFRSAN